MQLFDNRTWVKESGSKTNDINCKSEKCSLRMLRVSWLHYIIELEFFYALSVGAKKNNRFVKNTLIGEKKVKCLLSERIIELRMRSFDEEKYIIKIDFALENTKSLKNKLQRNKKNPFFPTRNTCKILIPLGNQSCLTLNLSTKSCCVGVIKNFVERRYTRFCNTRLLG